MWEGTWEKEKEALRASFGLPVGQRMCTTSGVWCILQAGPPSPQKAHGCGCVHTKGGGGGYSVSWL